MKTYYIGILVLFALHIILDIFTAYNSAQGTMTNDEPRKLIPTLIYAKLVLLLPELLWTVLGSYWAFGDSTDCETHIVIMIRVAVIAGWVLFIVIGVIVVLLFDPLGKYRTKNLSGVEDSEASQRIWEKRYNLSICCIHCVN